MLFPEPGLVIEEIELRGATGLKEIDDPFGLGVPPVCCVFVKHRARLEFRRDCVCGLRGAGQSGGFRFSPPGVQPPVEDKEAKGKDCKKK